MDTEAPLNKEIGLRLRALRESRGIRRERVALALEMGSENLRNYESGKQRMTLTMLPPVADLFGLTVPDLVSALFDARSNPSTTAHSRYEKNIENPANYNYTEWLKRRLLRCAVSRPSRQMLRPALAQSSIVALQ